MNKYFKYLFAIVIFPLLMLLTGCDSESAFSESTVTDATSVSLQLTPVNDSVANGLTKSFTATLTYTDNNVVNVTTEAALSWSSSDKSVATIENTTGIATGQSVGTTTITASGTFDGIKFDNTATLTVTNATAVSLQLTPVSHSMAIGLSKSFTAKLTYTDNNVVNVTTEAALSWSSSDKSVATIDNTTGIATGQSMGTTTITASGTFDGIKFDKTATLTVTDLAGPIIDIFDTGAGKLFTSSPSVAYLDSIGGSATNGTVTEDGIDGPAGDFYRFDWTNSNALCTTYNTHSLGGRTNWRLATRNELKVELYDASGPMFTARGWPTTWDYYWSVTPDGSNHYYVSLYYGYVLSYGPSSTGYASCVSNP